MNVSQLLKKISFELTPLSSSPVLDARILIEHTLARDEAFLLAHPETLLTNSQYSKIRKIVNRRKNGEPIAYITGHKEFFGYDFFINKNVLIPRPESEELVQLALQRIKNHELRIMAQSNPPIIHNSVFNILDLGTGSGCLIVALALEILKNAVNRKLSTVNFYASDISKKALGVAKKNAKRLMPPVISTQADSSAGEKSYHKHIKFFQSDLFSNRLLHKKYDLIIANLPYVPREVKSLKSKVKSLDFEPTSAIFADDNGAAVIKRFLREAKDRLTLDGSILIELDPRNAHEIRKFAEENYPKAKIDLRKDLAHRDRYLMIEN